MNTKEKSLQALQKAINQTIENQDTYREKIKELDKNGNTNYRCKSHGITWGNILLALKGTKWMPIHEDFSTPAAQKLKEILKNDKLNQVEDDDIKSKVFELSSIYDQYNCLKYTYIFFKTLGAKPDDELAIFLFSLWRSRNMSAQIIDNMQDAGSTVEMERHRQSLQFLDGLAGSLLENGTQVAVELSSQECRAEICRGLKDMRMSVEEEIRRLEQRE